MVRQVKYLKCEFYKNDDDKGGAMDAAIKSVKEGEITVHSHTQKMGRLWGNCAPAQLLAMLEKNHGLYEVISTYPHKMYFDVDKKNYDTAQAMEYLAEVKATIHQFYPAAEFAVSGSITEGKTSFHIILTNYVIHTAEEREVAKQTCRHIKDTIDNGFDWTVYTKNRNMKAIFQSKLDGRVQELIENDDWKSHLITCYLPNYSLPFLDPPGEIKEKIFIDKSKKTFNLGELPKMRLVCPAEVNLKTITADEVLALLPNTGSCNFTYRHLVARFCFTNGISYETLLAWICQRFGGVATAEKQAQWSSHWANLPKFPPASIEKMKPILAYYYPHINKDKSYRAFVQTFDLPADRTSKIERLSQAEFRGAEKYALVNIGMGGGKTAQTIDFLKTTPQFVWICPNKALSHNTKARLTAAAVDVAHYEKVSAVEKRNGALAKEEKLIVVVNSLHYVGEKTYDVVVIDEVETLLDKFLGDFMDKGGKKRAVWNAFLNVLRSAKKVVLLDAFITTKTINFIRAVENGAAHFHIYERLVEPSTRKVTYVKEEKKMVLDIVEKLKAGKKVFVFYPHKDASGKQMSMATFGQILENESGKKGILYNADVDDSVKRGLQNVNESWADASFVLTNSVITCGVNYDTEDFDNAYIFVASYCSPRDIIQVSYRARYLSSREIKVCYLGSMRQTNAWAMDTDKMACPLYSSLMDDILCEKQSPLKKTMNLFCVRAHYRQAVDGTELSDALTAHFDKMLSDNVNCGFSYDSIDEISPVVAENIERLIFAQEATMVEKVALKKYYFRMQFRPEGRDASIDLDGEEQGALAFLWDNRWIHFLEKIPAVLRQEGNLFRQIQTHNKATTLFPRDIKKTKLSPEIIQQIFREFRFKFITPLSGQSKIVKEIYNTYFKKAVVETTQDESAHVAYEFPLADLFDEILPFCEAFLKMNKWTDTPQTAEAEDGFSAVDL